jgi:hypothetical protein
MNNGKTRSALAKVIIFQTDFILDYCGNNSLVIKSNINFKETQGASTSCCLLPLLW